MKSATTYLATVFSAAMDPATMDLATMDTEKYTLKNGLRHKGLCYNRLRIQ
jgi:hypothetical protein